jgi:hypothetical protein
MTSWLSRTFAALRVLFGLNDPTDDRLHPAHGWLLPPSRGARLAPARVPERVSLAPERRW